jgi:hypothetical protein
MRDEEDSLPIMDDNYFFLRLQEQTLEKIIPKFMMYILMRLIIR